MRIRDRVRELRRVKASLLRPHPKNWRTHPAVQKDALRGLLAEIGYADALLVRELADGSLELIDGHLRAEITPDLEVPVLVVDLDDREAAKLLALHDPLAELAEPDHDLLADLVEHVETENEAVRAVLDQMLSSAAKPWETGSEEGPPPEVPIPESYQVVIECNDEAEQQALYERFTAEGLTCRLLTL
jgi:ParB-like chromosome segregation protein Spo0J